MRYIFIVLDEDSEGEYIGFDCRYESLEVALAEKAWFLRHGSRTIVVDSETHEIISA